LTLLLPCVTVDADNISGAVTVNSVKAAGEAGQDPKSGKPRAKSGVGFPYWDLEKSIEVVRVIHEKAGGIADNAQVATLLGYSGVENGNFRTRMSAARMFGLTETADDRRIRVTARGRSIIAPVTPAESRRGRLDAFMEVELFRKVFDRFNGTTLPESVGLKNLLENEYKIVPDRVAPTVRILLDSAEQAGLFEASGGNRTRLVTPLGLDATAQFTVPSVKAEVTTDERPPSGTGSGGADSSSSGIDPAIVGLLRRLPPGGTPMSEKRRNALIQAFTNVVEFLYPSDADEVP
jgi:hypothetical protein